jgi:hypothetical protein
MFFFSIKFIFHFSFCCSLACLMILCAGEFVLSDDRYVTENHLKKRIMKSSEQIKRSSENALSSEPERKALFLIKVEI